MKTFSDLIEEVINLGRCQRCGGCVAFCTALNYGALEFDEDGNPRFKDKEKCLGGGLCYAICPETHELDDEVKKLVNWDPPIGCVLDSCVARAVNPNIQKLGADGGAVTALLCHLFDKGQIDGAIVTKKTGLFQRVPWLATTREEIIESAGFHFDTLHSLQLFSELYSTYSPTLAKTDKTNAKHLERVAFVGTPCQVSAIRRIKALNMEPANAITIILGLFCAGSFIFGPEQQSRLEEIARFKWNQVEKINVKEHLVIHLQNKEVREISMDQLDFMKREACHYCTDYTAEFADISFGSIGAPEGWSTVITRTKLGQNFLNAAIGESIEIYSHKRNPLLATEVLEKAREWSEKKKQSAKKSRK